MSDEAKKKRYIEEYEFSMGEVIDRVKGLIHEGNRRLLVIRRDGVSLVKLPLSAAVIVAVIVMMTMAPLAILLAIVGLLNRLKLEVTPPRS